MTSIALPGTTFTSSDDDEDKPDPINLSLPDGRSFAIQAPESGRVPGGRRLKAPIPLGDDVLDGPITGVPTDGGGGGGGGGTSSIPPPDTTPQLPPPLIPGGGFQPGPEGDPTGGGGGGGAPPPAGPAVPPPGTSPLTGAERPFAVMPEDTQTFQDLIGPLRQQALEQIQNPGVFDDELFQESLEAGRRAVEADMARRGFAPESSGTIGGELFQKNVMLPLQRERLNRLTDARRQAFRQGTGLAQMAEQLAARQRGEQRTERGFIEQLRNRARRQAMQEAQMQEQMRRQRESDFLQLLGQAFGTAQPPIPGISRAGNLAGNAAGGFGQMAQQRGGAMGNLASLALTAFGPFGPF